MGADLSRVRFDARSDHAGVILQQGRVLLDADWNELVAITDRRMRAAAVDLGSPGPTPGIAGVAVVPKTTPDAFKLAFVAGKLTIGSGRMYVDGMCAENHGDAPLQWEPMLEDQQGTVDTAYDRQPYWPIPTPLPTTGTYLAYLDVWRREVTHLEQPNLVEVALGVDTTGRSQNAWAVRLFKVDGPGAATCSTPDSGIAGWPEVIAPSGARLTVDTIPVDDDDDPCALPPTGGYRGLENQTYRIEVHAAGGLGTATFKWSRDNASVASPVVEVLPGGLGVRPASLGRDSVLRFADGDWVEIIDDQRELSGLAGEIRFAEVHEEDGTVQFTPALPADLVLNTSQAAARHLRIRRWDQKGQIKSAAGGSLDNLLPTSSGVIKVPASSVTSVVLEHGVTVSFSGTNFKVGDHWIFAARVADTSVEKLTSAPPHGVHHHYARLGFVTFPGTVTNCPHPWPPDCECEDGDGCSDCTACVTPESHASGSLTIQMAVDLVKAAGGGTVCLKAGVFVLPDEGVVIDHAVSLKIRGVGPLSLVVARGRGFVVSSSAFVTLEDFSVISRGFGAVDARATLGLTVQRLTVLDVASRDVPLSAIGLDGVSLLTTLRDNAVIATFGIGTGDDDAALLTAELRISDNLLVCRESGINLPAGHLMSNAVTSNTVMRCAGVGIELPGAMAPGHGCEVTDNSVYVEGNGVSISAAGFTVDDNDIVGVSKEVSTREIGISVTGGILSSILGATRIADNRISNRGGAAISISAAMSEVAVSHNTISSVGQGIVMSRKGGAELAEIVHNRIVDLRSVRGAPAGIQVAGVATVRVESNTVNRIGLARDTRSAFGILVIGCPVSQVTANSVDGVGPLEQPVPSVGIAVAGAIDTTQVSGNTVRRQAISVDKDEPGSFTGMQIGSVGSGSAFAGGLSGTHAVLAAIGGPCHVTLDGNTVSGNAEFPTVNVEIEGSLIASGNHVLTRLEGAPALAVRANSASLGTNRLRGGNPSAKLEVDPKQLAVVGCLNTNGIEVFGAPLSAPWNALNPSGVT